jgi:carbonic anhydrase
MRKCAKKSEIEEVIKMKAGNGREGPQWGYDGEQGPENWGRLHPDFAPCAEGKQQSPVDLRMPSPENPADINFQYQPVAFNMLNNGHTVMAECENAGFMEVDGKRYFLKQIRFHSPSEHTMGGQPFEMEAQFIHESEDGQPAIVAVFIQRGDANLAYASLWQHVPRQAGEMQATEGVAVNAADLLPESRTYYHYDGSLTTPPCTEGVKWYIMAMPVWVSGAQLVALQRISDRNARPVQPFNNRVFHRKAPSAER